MQQLLQIAVSERIIPRFGIPLTLDSNRGTHCTGQVMHKFSAALKIEQKFHCVYHLQSSETVERKNSGFKINLAKICTETGLKWLDVLPLSLMYLISIVNRKHGLSPHEILMGRPMWLSYTAPLTPVQANLQLTDNSLLKYCQALMKCVRLFHTQLKETSPEPATEVCHSVNPGGWVYIKVFQQKTHTSAALVGT